jgi:hypothetical protein
VHVTLNDAPPESLAVCVPAAICASAGRKCPARLFYLVNLTCEAVERGQDVRQKVRHGSMFFWFAASPLWWLSGLPLGFTFGTPGSFGASMFLLSPSLASLVAMAVVLAGAGLLSSRALNY